MKETEKKKDVKLALCILLSLGISFFFFLSLAGGMILRFCLYCVRMSFCRKSAAAEMSLAVVLFFSCVSA